MDARRAWCATPPHSGGGGSSGGSTPWLVADGGFYGDRRCRPSRSIAQLLVEEAAGQILELGAGGELLAAVGKPFYSGREPNSSACRVAPNLPLTSSHTASWMRDGLGVLRRRTPAAAAPPAAPRRGSSPTAASTATGAAVHPGPSRNSLLRRLPVKSWNSALVENCSPRLENLFTPGASRTLRPAASRPTSR